MHARSLAPASPSTPTPASYCPKSVAERPPKPSRPSKKYAPPTSVLHTTLSTNNLKVQIGPRQPMCQILSHPLLSKLCEPTTKENYLFSVRIWLDDRLKDELDSGFLDPSRPYLTQPIATGSWWSCTCTIALPRVSRRKISASSTRSTGAISSTSCTPITRLGTGATLFRGTRISTQRTNRSTTMS